MHPINVARMAGETDRCFTVLREILELLNDNLGRLLHGIPGMPEIIKIHMNVLAGGNWKARCKYVLTDNVSARAPSGEGLEGHLTGLPAK